MSIPWHLRKLAGLSAASGVLLGGGLATAVTSWLWEGRERAALADPVSGRPYPCAVAVDSVLRAVGHTPVVRLKSLSELTGCEVFAKLEGMNPTGSMADRTAAVVLDHVVRAELHPSSTTSLVAATESKDLAQSLGAMAVACGRPLNVVMPRHMFQPHEVGDRSVLGALEAFGVTLERVQASAPLSDKALLSDPGARVDYHAQVMNDCLRHAEQSAATRARDAPGRLFLRVRRLEWAKAEGASMVADEARRQLRALGVRRLFAVAVPGSGALGAAVTGRRLAGATAGGLGDGAGALASAFSLALRSDGATAASSPSMDVCLARPVLGKGRRLSAADAAAVGAAEAEIDALLGAAPGCAAAPQPGEHDVEVTPGEVVRMASYLAMHEGIFVGPAGALAACAVFRAAKLARARRDAEHIEAELHPGSMMWELEPTLTTERPAVLVVLPDAGHRHIVNGIHDASWCKKALGIDLDAMRRRGMHFP